MSLYLKTPFEHLVPPLTVDEYAALREDIRVHGQRHPIDIDERNNILDGHHRWRACQEIGVPPQINTVEGLSESEKQLYVMSRVFKGRQLTQSARDEQRRKCLDIYAVLRKESPKTWTLARLGKEFGVDESTASRWFSNLYPQDAKPDGRRKISLEEEVVIAGRLSSGVKASVLSKETGLSKARLSGIRKCFKVPVATGTELERADKNFEECIANAQRLMEEAREWLWACGDVVAGVMIRDVFFGWDLDSMSLVDRVSVSEGAPASKGGMT